MKRKPAPRKHGGRRKQRATTGRPKGGARTVCPGAHRTLPRHKAQSAPAMELGAAARRYRSLNRANPRGPHRMDPAEAGCSSQHSCSAFAD